MPDAPDAAPRVLGLPRKREERNARTKEMVAFIVELRHREPLKRYGDIERALCDRKGKFGVSPRTAQRMISLAGEELAKEFAAFCQDAPRQIFDAYMALHHEHLERATSATRERDRVMHMANARQNLDSVRDMFGMRAAINVNINSNDGIPLDAFEALSDVQLEALAALDALADDGRRVLDAHSVEQSIELAGVALDEIGSNGRSNGTHDEE